MELVVISLPDVVDNESIIINNLFQVGLKYFHIRKPESDIQSVRELIDGIAPQFYNRISLHQFHEIATDYGIKRLHYTERDREESNDEKWALQKAGGYTLSTSVHDITQLPLIPDFEYVFYGPVFNSISKPGYKSTLPVDFKLDKSNIKPKVFALGGVNGFNLIKIGAMGFDGAAILGTIWADPALAISNFRALNEVYTY